MSSTADPPKRPEPAFQALQQRRAYEEIIDQVERAIAEGRLVEGDRLPSERELAETFGVGRSSVREALRVLETFGVVTARRGAGADAGSTVTAHARSGLVSTLRFHTALRGIPTADFVDLRAVLEAEAVTRAASLNTPPTEDLRALVDEMRAAPTVEEYHRLDTSFHVGLARISGNALLPLMMEGLRDMMARAMLRGFDRLTDWGHERDRLVAEHVEILDLIEAHDGARAAAVIRDHIQRFYSDTIAADAGLLD